MASLVALHAPKIEQKHRESVLKSQNCDLILVPTKEWGSGAFYQTLMFELDGTNDIKFAYEYQKQHPEDNDYLFKYGKHAPYVELVWSQANYRKLHNIKDEWTKGNWIFIFDIYWIDSERIFGVNIRDDKYVECALRFFVGTQYFKCGYITNNGKQHDKRLKRIKDLEILDNSTAQF